MSDACCSPRPLLFVALVLTVKCAGPAYAGQRQPPAPDLAPLEWLERVKDAPAGKLPAFRPIENQERVAEANRLADNDAARFARRLIASAWRLTGGHTKGDAVPALPVALEPGGNYAREGLRIYRDGKYVEQADLPYLLLALDEGSLSLTFLHEGGHVVDAIARRGRRYDAPWSALPHSTFAVTNPTTALGEGYAIHLETLWGHYGDTPARRAWYHRLDPNWNPERAFAGEPLAPIRDLLTFSQNWARYSGVRDGDVAFEGHVYDDSYLRSQYGPSRDGAQLRNGNGMVASEGVVAAVLFWIVDGQARSSGAVPLGGLDQPALLEAELRLVAALQRVPAIQEPYRADLVDLVAAYGNDPPSRRHALERFVGITRGVTARPGMRSAWAALHEAAVNLDIASARKLADGLEAARRELVEAAVKEPATLRAGVGPVLPVRLTAATVQLKALGEPFPIEFDLNAAGGAELKRLTPEPELRARIRAERDTRPFASFEDFEKRAGVALAALGAAPVK
jgi:hypothetical protein